MFAPKLGHVTRCVTRDGLTFVPFFECVALRCCSFAENNSPRKFAVLSSLNYVKSSGTTYLNDISSFLCCYVYVAVLCREAEQRLGNHTTAKILQNLLTHI